MFGQYLPFFIFTVFKKKSVRYLSIFNHQYRPITFFCLANIWHFFIIVIGSFFSLANIWHFFIIVIGYFFQFANICNFFITVIGYFYQFANILHFLIIVIGYFYQFANICIFLLLLSVLFFSLANIWHFEVLAWPVIFLVCPICQKQDFVLTTLRTPAPATQRSHSPSQMNSSDVWFCSQEICIINHTQKLQQRQDSPDGGSQQALLQVRD